MIGLDLKSPEYRQTGQYPLARINDGRLLWLQWRLFNLISFQAAFLRFGT